MKINQISSFRAYNNNFSISSNPLKSTQDLRGNEQYQRVTANQYLAFTGGYSMNLALTVENLKDSSFPPDVKVLAQKEVENGNPEDKTLIDIHKQKYSKINQMKSLEEVKEAFPEFEDVLPSDSVEYYANSFMDDVKNEKLEWFDSDVDLSLQLLQMYWADGFSLTDLKQYTNGKNIASTLEKLNIPRMDKTYGSVLKLSDKEYNERFSKEMSERQKGVARKRAEKQDGVFIPRGPMNDETKKKISESNIKFYAEHPEKVTEMSDRMKQFYEEHPEHRERLKKVLETSWGLREAKSVRKKMSKFLGKTDVSPKEFSDMATSNDKTARATLKDFWNRNVWAKEQWSKAMKKGWEIVKERELKEIEEKDDPKTQADITIQLYPPSLKEDMNLWLAKNGFDVEKIKDPAIYLSRGDKPAPKGDMYTHEAIVNYMTKGREDLVADMLQVGLLMANVTLNEQYLKPKFSNGDITPIKETIGYISKNLIDEIGVPKVLTTPEITDIYVRAMLYLQENGATEACKAIEKDLEKAYLLLKQNDRRKILNLTIESQAIARDFAKNYPKKKYEQDKTVFNSVLS